MNRTLRILHTESSNGWGGQEIRIISETLGMLGRGHNVSIAAHSESNIYRRATDAAIQCFSTNFDKKSVASIISLLTLINKERFDIINTHSSSDSWVASVAAQLSRLKPKIIRTRHISAPVSRSFLSRIIYDVLPDAVMTTGEQIRRKLIDHNGFNGSRIMSVPTGIDLGRFNPQIIQSCLPRQGFSVGMIGVLRSWKGHRYFLEAIPSILKEVPGTYFYIIGDGPQYRNINRWIEDLSLKDRVQLLGHREDIPEIIASLDVIVHPSDANEGIPQTLLQAMAMGKSIVASDTGAIRDVIHDGKTGFLIKPKNPKLIAERVIELYRDDNLRKDLGTNGRKLTEKEHSIETMLDTIEALYDRILH